MRTSFRPVASWTRSLCCLAALASLTVACDDTERATGLGSLSTERVSASSSSLPHINDTRMMLPAEIGADLAAYDCSNNPGPQITFAGLTTLGGYGVEMTFTNNLKGTHTYSDAKTVSSIVAEAGERIVVPKQPVLGGVGGNPFIWVQFINGDGSPATGEIFAGRCVQGASWHVDGPAATRVSAHAEFEITGCENSPGPTIQLGSSITSGGLIARIVFRNNDNPVGGPHDAEVTRDITMIGPGVTYEFPKQPVLGGVGGNPWIFAGFTDVDARPLGVQSLLGRCEQLSKALE